MFMMAFDALIFVGAKWGRHYLVGVRMTGHLCAIARFMKTVTASEMRTELTKLDYQIEHKKAIEDFERKEDWKSDSYFHISFYYQSQKIFMEMKAKQPDEGKARAEVEVSSRIIRPIIFLCSILRFITSI